MYNLIAFLVDHPLRKCENCGTTHLKHHMLHQAWLIWFCGQPCAVEDFETRAW